MIQPVQASSYTFRRLIEGGYVYVDKTRYLYELIREAIGIYFLARPRRFGKSLTVSTLEEIFKGNKELFRGLWLYESDYTWPTHPVIHIDFSRYQVRTVADLEVRIQRHLRQIAEQYHITLDDGPFDIQFEDLVVKLSAENQVVILIDEYDKPILDNIDNLAEAQHIRRTLKSFYGAIKSLDQYLRFVFITGISKFSRVGIFSDMNNLDDLTMDVRMAAALGITEDELRTNFQGHIAAFAQKEGITPEVLLEKIRHWYNGFCFVEGCPTVYNPFSTLQLFNKQRFANYWFETGTPTFLIKLIQQNNYDIRQLDALELSALGFSTYELEELEIIPLLFQTGYLTIKGYRAERQLYQLGYPNMEVENAFLTHLLAAFNQVSKGLNESHLWKLIDALQAQDFPRFLEVLAVFFANIPYDLHVAQEKYYQTIFYLIFRLLGVYADAEVKTNTGRIDAVVELADQLFLFEFKLDKSAAEALPQIKNQEYYQKYRLRPKAITLIGANFDSEKRQVTEWKTQKDPAGQDR
jgi:hypothetical protein